MNPYVRDRITRKLETLNDERLYQVLDYVEFLESKYAEKPAPVANVFQRFTDGVEDTLRAGGLAVGTVSEAMGFLNKAVGVLNNVAQTTKTVATDVVSAAKTAADQIGAPPPGGAPTGSTPANPPSAAAQAAPDGAPPAPPTAPPSAPGSNPT
ncbi:MAG TPA: hypothetical protein VGE27_05570 [Gemmatimonas sp.]|uniref:hypothetical protein n=1 Tax=Gemmatimonas sp. TaxID=1962908 RepID=UPI002ED837FE